MSQSLNNNNNNNNNNSLKIDPSLTNLTPTKEEPPSTTSLTPLHPAHHWERKHRLQMAASVNCKTNKDSSIAILEDFYKRACFAGNPPTTHPENIVSRVTPTSSDQRLESNEYVNGDDHRNSRERGNTVTNMVTDNDEEVIVDNADDENENVRDKRRTAPTTPNSDNNNKNR